MARFDVIPRPETVQFAIEPMKNALRVASFVAYVLMMVSLIALVPLHALFSMNPVVIGLQVLATALLLWARITFGRRSYHVAATPTKGGLVTTGPYRYVRHPIYASVCLLGWSGIAVHWSFWPVICGLGLLLTGLLRLYWEEKLVSEQYPEYREYMRTTWRMLPYVF